MDYKESWGGAGESTTSALKTTPLLMLLHPRESTSICPPFTISFMWLHMAGLPKGSMTSWRSVDECVRSCPKCECSVPSASTNDRLPSEENKWINSKQLKRRWAWHSIWSNDICSFQPAGLGPGPRGAIACPWIQDVHCVCVCNDEIHRSRLTLMRRSPIAKEKKFRRPISVVCQEDLSQISRVLLKLVCSPAALCSVQWGVGVQCGCCTAVHLHKGGGTPLTPWSHICEVSAIWCMQVFAENPRESGGCSWLFSCLLFSPIPRREWLHRNC